MPYAEICSVYRTALDHALSAEYDNDMDAAIAYSRMATVLEQTFPWLLDPPCCS